MIAIWNINITIWQYTVCGSFANGIENDWSRHEIKNDPTYYFSARYLSCGE